MDKAARLAQLADAIETRVIGDPAILGSIVGFGLGTLVDQSRANPAGTLDDVERFGPVVEQAVAYVLRGEAPGPELRAYLPGLV